MSTPIAFSAGHRLATRATWTGIAAVCTVWVAGCATPPVPTEQLALSTAAIAHAVTAGAPELAPGEIKLAQDKLERAHAAVATKDYDRALALAQEAQADAALAEAKSGSLKARKAADASREANKALREEMDRKVK